jgi:hypothetical protein
MMMGMMLNLKETRAVLIQERMNSPLEGRKVRLRGLGGTGVCGDPGSCASATGRMGSGTGGGG